MANGAKKVSVIGAGNVGATCAFVLAEKKIGEIVLLDIFEGFAKGKALDMSQGGRVLNYDGRITGTKDYRDIAGSDVVVVTSGFPRQPGMSREDLIGKNADIITQVGNGIREFSPDAVVVVVTNPLDLMTYHMQKVTGFPHNRIVGQAGILDSARMTHFISEAVGCSNEDVQAMVLGGHGDTMVPLVRYSTVAGIPIPDLLEMGWSTQKKIDDIVQRTRDGGAEIVGLLKTGSAFYAPAESAVQMADAFLKDKKKLLPCAAFVDGPYNLDGIYVGVPVVIGKEGVERIVEINLSAEEKQMFNHSVESVKKLNQLAQNFEK